MVTLDHSLQSAIDALSVPGIIIGHRLISPGDEDALWPDERLALPRGSGGAPTWPTGIVGSLSHDARVAVAAIGRCRDVHALGIDVEPAESLPSELLDLIATPQERLSIRDDPYHGRLLFVAKEAVYKAVYPLDQVFLEHHDVQIKFAERKAIVRNGRVVELRFCIATHLVALAFMPALGSESAT